MVSSPSSDLVFSFAQQFSAGPVSASFSSCHHGRPKPPPQPPRSEQMASLHPLPSHALQKRSHWRELPLPVPLHSPLPKCPFLPITPKSEAELVTSYPTLEALSFFLAFSPCLCLTQPLQSSDRAHYLSSPQSTHSRKRRLRLCLHFPLMPASTVV